MKERPRNFSKNLWSNISDVATADRIGSLIKNTLLNDEQHELFTCMHCSMLFCCIWLNCVPKLYKNETQFHINNIIAYNIFMKSTKYLKEIKLMISCSYFNLFAFGYNTNARQIKIWNDNDRL